MPQNSSAHSAEILAFHNFSRIPELVINRSLNGDQRNSQDSSHALLCRFSMATSKPGRVITEAEREALKALNEQREELKNEYNSRRVVAVSF
jgi:hypothetical protein